MSALAKLYAKAVIEGKRTFKNIPEILKPDVREILIKEKREDLITE